MKTKMNRKRWIAFLMSAGLLLSQSSMTVSAEELQQAEDTEAVQMMEITEAAE